MYKAEKAGWTREKQGFFSYSTADNTEEAADDKCPCSSPIIGMHADVSLALQTGSHSPSLALKLRSAMMEATGTSKSPACDGSFA
jgi:hypothetical protein